MIADPHEIQRLRYTPGQDLLSRDFRDQATFESELRWWHNRALHGAFGVRYGLRVKVLPGAPEPTVAVGAGLAYDAFGRELLLPAPRTVRLPANSSNTGPQVLVIRYREDVPSRSDLAGACGCGTPAPQGAALAWVAERRLRPADGVPLARTGDVGALDPRFDPPAARPLARPRLGHGATLTGGTAWEVWNLGAEPGALFGLRVSIDTRAAGFTRPPCYFAWLQGSVETSLTESGPKFPLPFFPEVAEESLTGFRFRVVTFVFGKPDDAATNRNLILSRARLQLSVSWLGIQMRHDDEPLPEVIHGHS